MTNFRCTIKGFTSDLFIAACVKKIEKNNDLIQFLNPSQRGIRNKYFINFCAREYGKKNYQCPPTQAQIEKDFGFEFCFIEARRRDQKSISHIPSFSKPIIFLIQSRRKNRERLLKIIKVL